MTLTFFSTSPNNITANSSNQDALQPPTDQHLSIATHKKVLGFTPTRYSGYKNVGLAERKIFDIDACVAAGMFDVVLAATTPKMTPSKRFKTTAWLNKSLKVHDQQVFVLKSLDRDDTLYPRDIGLASLALQKFNLCKEMGGFRPKLWGPTLRGQIATLAADIKKLLRDPFAISDALQALESELREKMHVVMEDKPFHPVTQILMGPDGYFLPSLNGIKPFPTKGHILETLLRNREEQAGINIDCVPVADGYAGVREANDVLADDQGSAHLFKENEAHSDFLLHGKNTHRLQWECIRQWVQKGKLTLPKKTDGTTLSFAELNAIFAHVMVDRPGQALESLWQFTIDNISDLHGYDIEPPNTDDDDYLPFLHRGPSDGVSGVAPMEFISTIKCFGKELGLPYLQTCLVDSQIKQVNKMASRLVSLLDTEDNKSLQDMITKNTGLANWEDVKKSPGAYLHDAIVLFMLGTRESANEFGNSYPWTISNTDDIKRIEKKAEQTFQRNEREKFEAIYQAPSNNRWKKFVIKSDGK